MLASQRYPLYLTAWFRATPAMNTGYLNLALPWAAVVFNQIAPEDPSGKPVASQDYSANDGKF
jgi:hypothetical protein